MQLTRRLAPIVVNLGERKLQLSNRIARQRIFLSEEWGAQAETLSNTTVRRISIHSPALYFSLTQGADGAVAHMKRGRHLRKCPLAGVDLYTAIGVYTPP